jgi:enoyl-[acyl-carrier protein] reductase I
LKAKKGLILGIANDKSIAYGCARVMRRLGAELAVTYLNTKAEPHVRPLAAELQSPLILPCDVEQPGQLETVFEAMQKLWGKIDFVVHSIAYAPKEDLQGRVVDSSREGFARAMDVSCHSFIRAARLAEPLMSNGGCLITMSYHGARRLSPTTT